MFKSGDEIGRSDCMSIEHLPGKHFDPLYSVTLIRILREFQSRISSLGSNVVSLLNVLVAVMRMSREAEEFVQRHRVHAL